MRVSRFPLRASAAAAAAAVLQQLVRERVSCRHKARVEGEREKETPERQESDV